MGLSLKKTVIFLTMMMLLFLVPAESSAVVTGEEGLFSAVAPDTVIILDVSASMQTNPIDSMDGDGKPIKLYGNTDCSGTTFYNTPQPGYGTKCQKFLIAQRAIFNVLDDNKDGVINSQDDASLNIRMGFYSFGSAVYRNKDIGKSYANIFCGKSSCSLSNPYDYTGTGNVLYLTDDRYPERTYSSNTAIALALEEVKTYLEGHKAADKYRSCRQKFVILVTDGGDTKYCEGNGDGNQADQYKRRRASVLRAKDLADAGYKVFVIGLAQSVYPFLLKTMNWMAYHGGTDNPQVANSGNPASLNVGYFSPDPCAVDDTIRLTGDCGGGSPFCYVTTADPGIHQQSARRLRLPPQQRVGAGDIAAAGHRHHPAPELLLLAVLHRLVAGGRREFHLRGLVPAQLHQHKVPVLVGVPGEVSDRRERQRRSDAIAKRRHQAAGQGFGPADHVDVQIGCPHCFQHGQHHPRGPGYHDGHGHREDHTAKRDRGLHPRRVDL